ncbi:cytochrome b [Shewanella baltica]|uniref:Cytochrome B561 n=1 Tax=Shewanella baltica (strain OS195) TaxID=399599 RepID=A9KXQ9_SHEB9|nr:cytochrome b [Shewanella baltica]ABX50361.1 cytochrome B561 [Shewanella baltica OS195]ADT95347.1 Cytochrome b/b6 domain [Shewanella baltica OS678]EHC06483.1 cytochrome b561 [Shewanella baltica OS625]
MFRNSKLAYGITAIVTHWLSAIVVIGLFAVGVWMVELTYYSAWYKTAPYLHKSVGILLLAVTLFRLLWRLVNPKPVPEANHKPWERQAAHIAHLAIYVLLLVIMCAGILISTAEGRGIMVFDWFELPGFGPFFENQADIAGDIHQYAAYSLIALVVIHAAGALKHHFIDKDATLLKMIKFNRG